MKVVERNGAKRHFWKFIPRFDKCFGFTDLTRSLSKLSERQKKEAAIDTCSDILAACDLPPSTLAFLARTGRESLWLALKTLDLRPHSKVGVPLFCCACVFEAIVAAGHIPVFLDVDLQTYNLEPSFIEGKRREIDALIVVHTFGYPAELNQLRSSLAGRIIPIIEDCAHSLFSEYDGRPTGTCTELSIFSFGLRKPATAGGGGLLVVNDRDLAAKAETECSNLDAESRWRQARHAFRCWGRSLAYRPAAYGAFLASPLGQLKDREHDAENDGISESMSPNWSTAGIRTTDLARVCTSVDGFRRKIGALAECTEILRSILVDSPVEIPDEPSNGKWNHFWLPIRYRDAQQRDRARQFLRARRIDMPAIWPTCVHDAQRSGYTGGCRQSEEAAQTVCRIPIYSWFKRSDLEYIADSVRMSTR